MLGQIRDFVDAILAARRRQADIRFLSALSDHMLDDLGILREDIVERVARPAKREAEQAGPQPAYRIDLAPCG